ncbi:MAG: hypothetical protein U0792_04380 [Gemmataceae bacterium]
MNRSHHRILAAALALLMAGILVPAGADDQKPAKPAGDDHYPPNVTTEEQKLEYDLRGVRRGSTETERIKRLLAAYPFVSLEERLKFDGPGRKRVDQSLPTAKLELGKWQEAFKDGERKNIPPATFAMLLAEDRLKQEEHFDRMQALANLHKLEVHKFVTNPGFGIRRVMVRGFLERHEQPPKDWSEGDRGEVVTLPKQGSFFTPNKDEKGPTLPATMALTYFHAHAAHEFTRPDSWGLVKDKKQVAGFKPHTLEFAPDYGARQRHDTKNPTKDKDGKITGYPLIERWAIRKVELVGLLMHESPVVYLTEGNQLPTMKAAKDAKTRELEQFEKDALKELAAGKEAVHVAATVNQIRMVGAIRMAEACMKCHEGKQGDLLGAFTYDLVRDPAYIAPEK